MAARINLLPHRQIKRAERQREFNLLLIATLIAAGAIIFLGQTVINSGIDSQMSRNKRLDIAIADLDKQIEVIKELKSKINEVLERKKIVEDLQINRGQAVVLLDEVTRKLPEGIYLRSIKQIGSVITLEGIADTNARVATLVRNLSISEWMTSPGLLEIKSETVNGNKRNNFTLNVVQQLKTAEDKELAKKTGPQ